jgi:hypothetical protein
VRLRLEVLDPLRLVEDDDVGRPSADRQDVAHDRLVVGDLEEDVRLAILRVPCRSGSRDDDCRLLGELPDLAPPLLLHRRRTHDEHLREAEDRLFEDGRGDRLGGLPEAHFVCDDRGSPEHRELDAFALIRVEIDLQRVRVDPMLSPELPHLALVLDLLELFDEVVVKDDLAVFAGFHIELVEPIDTLARVEPLLVEELAELRLEIRVFDALVVARGLLLPRVPRDMHERKHFLA